MSICFDKQWGQTDLHMAVGTWYESGDGVGSN